MREQSNQAAVDAGFKALNSLFLLNGAAATALLAQAERDFKVAALFFASGAFISIICLAMAHFLCLAITDTFVYPQPERDDDPWVPSPIWGEKKYLSTNALRSWRFKIVLVGTASAVVFLIGLFYTALLLWN